MATKVGVASLRQVPGAVHHMLALRKADLVEIVWRRPSRREAIQTVAPASSPALLAVLRRIPRLGFWSALAHEGLLLLLPGLDHLLLVLGIWLYFLLLYRNLERRLLFLQGDGFLRDRRTNYTSSRPWESGPLFLDRDGFWRRGLHFPLFLKERVGLRGFKVVLSESPGLRWGRRGCIANFMKVQEQVLGLHLFLL